MSSARSATNSAPVEAAFDARGFLATLTESPGVYRMLAADRAVLYVGKAKNLKKRVASYFNKGGHSPRIALMLQQVAAMEVTPTDVALRLQTMPSDAGHWLDTGALAIA